MSRWGPKSPMGGAAAGGASDQDNNNNTLPYAATNVEAPTDPRRASSWSSLAPPETATTTTSGSSNNESMQQQQQPFLTGIATDKIPDNNNNNIATTTTTTPPDDEEDADFEIIHKVEWGPRPDQPDYDTDQELAPRPRPTASTETCLCAPQEGACSDLSCLLVACQEECRPLSCPAKQFCNNQRLQKPETFPQLQVVAAGNKGRGLVTLESVSKGRICAEYCGRAVKASKLKQLFRRYQTDRRMYIMALDKDVVLDARKKGNIARYINHSCNPNCKVERWRVRGIVRAAVVALRDLQPNEELTFDYKWERKRGRAPTKCHCGEVNCRGTLEMPKSLEEADLEQKLEDQWQASNRVDVSIVNRTIRMFSKEHEEYFLGEVTGFDPDTNLHSILYRHDMSEVWEDLAKENWMLLNANVDKSEFMIAKKSKRRRSPTSNLVAAPVDDAVPFKHFLYVQTPTYQALQAKHILEQCERNCVVQIHVQQFCKPPLPPKQDDKDEVEKYRALEQSSDGTVWKLTISGSGVADAFQKLEKHVSYLDKKMDYEVAQSAAAASAATNSAVNGTAQQNSASALAITEQQQQQHQVIFPRDISDAVKRDLPALRAKCRSVNLNFVASESLSKQFARLVLDGALESDIQAAKETIWNAFLALCLEANAPVAPNKVPRNLGFYAGELTAAQFRLMCGDSQDRLRMDASEDLSRCPFFASFESTQRCTVWVQANYDKGRINSSNLIVSQADMNTPKNVFIGCSPKDIPRLWGLIQTRVSELARGVKYLHLGMDRVYQKLMMMNGNRFFDFVQRVAGVKLDIDSMTGDHIRIDGRIADKSTVSAEVAAKSEPERALLAEEIIHLQIELYRDQCTREQSWIFGRDWSLVASSVSASSDSSTSGALSLGQLDSKSAAQGAGEIAETVAMLDLNPSIAAHAAIILYRYSVVKEPDAQVKVRDTVLACIYLANKCQKAQKWKRLEQVLKTGFEAMYKSKFDQNQDLQLLAEKVVAMEADILETLNYDVVWRGVEWIRTVAAGTGRIEKARLEEITDFMFSSPVLACGHAIWLRYGPEYIFAVAAAFLQVDIDHLLEALSLIPLKVSQAAELLVETVKPCRLSGKKAKTHKLLEGNKIELEKRLPRVKQMCLEAMTKTSQHVTLVSSGTSPSEQRYKIMSKSTRQQAVLRGVSSQILRDCIAPFVARITSESSCSLYVERGPRESFDDIVLDGTWRAIYVAYNLMREASTSDLPALEALSLDLTGMAQMQAKVEPGRVEGEEVQLTNGWEETWLSKICNESVKDRRIGGKNCISGRISSSALRDCGLRWWLPQEEIASRSGNLVDVLHVRVSENIGYLGAIAKAVQSKTVSFPILSSLATEEADTSVHHSFAAVSLQEWPPEKVAAKEVAKFSRSKGEKIPIGFSAAALQELQLFKQLHGLICTPLGHPNLLLPVAVAVTTEKVEEPESIEVTEESGTTMDLLSNPMFSMFQTSDDKAKKKDKKIALRPHVVFQPTPFVLQRFLSKKHTRGMEDIRNHSALLSSWFHDILSAVVHCHSNNIILRNIQVEQIAVDHTGTLKFGGLYRSLVVASEQRDRTPAQRHADLLKATRSMEKEKRKKDEGDDISNPYTAPENVLGCPKFSQEGDMWAVGCILAHLLLNKPVFQGKDRSSLFASLVKVVGTPREDNFELLKKFPHFPKQSKKYKRGVEKALEHMLKDEAAAHGKAVDLIARMLHLDPLQRCTAAQALGHEYMVEHAEKSNTPEFRKQFVSEWLAIKSIAMKQSQGPPVSSNTKRKAMLMASAADEDDDDDLYDVDDLLAEQSNKRSRSSPSSFF